ncbi:MAG: exodeoxyribonuclease VII large subunit [bacterium]
MSNLVEYSVSELSGKIKHTLEDTYGMVRVRGEIGRVTRAASGHVYLDLKDERAVMSSVIWKGNAARLKIQPEQGMEMIATGKLTTFAGQSRYQLMIDRLEPAGVGALMALFEERKKKLAEEGLFAEERKKALPYLPKVIGVVTSPSGAVIRDILHRLRDRFPCHVLVWPALVQGDQAAGQIVAGIEGFNKWPPTGPLARPDILIVARGGGSLEDLWCFNEENVVRAAAASSIPLISAVGHETDTTLIDYAADRRAPTPTAAAEMAVPVRTELISEVLNKTRRAMTAQSRLVEQAAMALTSATRALGRAESLMEGPSQQFDRASERLRGALQSRIEVAQSRLLHSSGGIRATTLRQNLTRYQQAVDHYKSRLEQVQMNKLSSLEDRLQHAGKLLETLSYKNILERGFALVTTPTGEVIRQAAAAKEGMPTILHFADGEKQAIITRGDHRPKRPSSPAPSRPPQGTLFD